MSYLSLLFSSATQSRSNASGRIRETEREAHAASEAAEGAWIDAGSRPDDYRLPPGIVSLDHWLDLNA